MINYIKGSVNSISEGYIILECSGIGYKINMPSSSLIRLSAGQSACVYTYMSVKEDGISLFGFLTASERQVFELLIGVSGIGPKGAIGILSSISADELKMAVACEDSKLIASAKGIGLKTAQKIVLELKGKIEKDFETESGQSADMTVQFKSSGSVRSHAADVLEALGFSRTAASAAVGAVYTSEDMTAEEIVNEALKIIE